MQNIQTNTSIIKTIHTLIYTTNIYIKSFVAEFKSISSETSDALITNRTDFRKYFPIDLILCAVFFFFNVAPNKNWINECMSIEIKIAANDQMIITCNATWLMLLTFVNKFFFLLFILKIISSLTLQLY